MSAALGLIQNIAPAHSRRREGFLALAVCTLIGGLWIATKHPLIGIAVSALPISLVAILSRPLAFVLGFVVFSFFRIHEVFPQLYPLKIPLLLSLAALLSLAWNLWTGRIQAYWCKEFTAFVCFFLLVSSGVLDATNRGAAIGAFTGVFVKIAIMVFAIAWSSVERDAFKAMTRVILLAGISVSAVALYNKLNGIGLVEGTRVTIGRDIGSMLGDPNDLALVLLFPAGFALAMVLNRGTAWLEKLLGLLTISLVVAAVIATQSRGGLLGITTVIGIFAYRRIKSKTVLFIGAALALMVLFAVAGITDRASGGGHEEGIDESAMGRIYAWEAAFGMALAHPLNGVGIGNFISNYWSYSSHWDGRNHAVHSTWFGVLAEAGFLGLGLFVTMIALALRRVLQTLTILARSGTGPYGHVEAYVMAEAILAGLASFVVSGTFLTMGFTWPVYILLALCAAVGRYAQTANNAHLHQIVMQVERPTMGPQY